LPGERLLAMTVPFLPPSDNHIRVHRRQGGEVYSKEAEAFRAQFRAYAQANYFVPIQRFVQGHHPAAGYRLVMVFYFDTLVNQGWIETDRSGKRKAKAPYKRMDAGNRRKLIEDCLASTLGIDDSLSMELTLVKSMDPDRPRVEIILQEVSPADYGIPSAYLRRDGVLP